MARIPLHKVPEKGHISTGSAGNVTLYFSKAYPSKPKLLLTPELAWATDQTFAQISSWVTDEQGRYTGAVIYTSDDGGRAEPNVIVHYIIEE